jgi:hypothetical protein
MNHKRKRAKAQRAGCLLCHRNKFYHGGLRGGSKAGAKGQLLRLIEQAKAEMEIYHFRMPVSPKNWGLVLKGIDPYED